MVEHKVANNQRTLALEPALDNLDDRLVDMAMHFDHKLSESFILSVKQEE